MLVLSMMEFHICDRPISGTPYSRSMESKHFKCDKEWKGIVGLLYNLFPDLTERASQCMHARAGSPFHILLNYTLSVGKQYVYKTDKGYILLRV